MIRTKVQQPRRSRRTKVLLVIAGAVILVLAVLAILELTHVTNFIHKKTPTVTGKPTKPNDATHNVSPSKGEPSSNASNSSSGSTQPGDDKTQAPTTDTSAPLQAPTGTFVSNHHPNLSGSPAPNTEHSTCVTTPGATCQIIFTNGSTTKSLPAQTTDRSGATYWDWKLQDIGLTAGSWTVQAKAVLGSQTQTASDAMALEVQP